MIFTFYSYKGGVGRTMALTNIAELFYQAGLKVLMVDWDLEAPGIERFFQNALNPEKILDKPGIIDMLLEYKQQMAQPKSSERSRKKLAFEKLEQFLVPVYQPTSDKGELWLLSAGRRSEGHFSKYANTVLTFDWTDFYQNWEGERYFEWLRQQFEQMADIVLIDSRTGITEMGEVCTYHLADTCGDVLAPNQQNLLGTYKMARNFTNPAVQNSRGGRLLNILVIPSRIERAESELLDEFQEAFIGLFSEIEFNGDIDIEKLWELNIPYIPKYAFSEEVAVRDGDRASAEDIDNAFRNLHQIMELAWFTKLATSQPNQLIKSLALRISRLDYNKDKNDLLNLISITKKFERVMGEYKHFIIYIHSLEEWLRGNYEAAYSQIREITVFNQSTLMIEDIVLPIPNMIISTKAEDIISLLDQALKLWHSLETPNLEPLSSFRLYKNIDSHSNRYLPEEKAILNSFLIKALEALSEQNAEAALLLRRRYIDDKTGFAVANSLGISESLFYRRRREAMQQLANIILYLERETILEYQRNIEERLGPITYKQLFGVDKVRYELYKICTDSIAPWIVSINGIGGIGKTTLADALVRDERLSNRFHDVLWISLTQQQNQSKNLNQGVDQLQSQIDTLVNKLFKQLNIEFTDITQTKSRLNLLINVFRSRPYLVVIDNLETIADIQSVIHIINQLTNPTKFLLTSRISLHNHPEIYNIPLTELNREDTIALITYEAKTRNIKSVLQASKEQIEGIYNVVGGNPFALKLVIGQANILSPSQILENIRKAQGAKVDSLYSHVFRQAWGSLSNNSRQVLLAMPFTSPEGASLTQLISITNLDPSELSQALEQLIAMSLVEVKSGFEQSYYYIHRLTESFLSAQVAKWIT